MKHKIKTILITAFVVPLVAILTLVPLYVEREDTQKKALHKLQEAIGHDLHNPTLRWRWLPTPHLSIRQAQITTDSISLLLPITDLYLDWPALAHKKIHIEKIEIKFPELLLKASSAIVQQPISSPEQIKLPDTMLAVKNGSLKIDKTLLPPIFQDRSVQISGIDSEINLVNNTVNLDLDCGSNFCKRIGAQGSFNLKNKTYKLQINAQTLRLHQAIKSILEGEIIPADSVANFTGSIEGRGLETITASLVGELPCFTIKPKDSNVFLNCGLADIVFKKDGPDYGIHINEFVLKDPGISLSGDIKRTASGSDAEIPKWLIDLHANDVDLNEIRHSVLLLWGEHPITRKVCDIVRGGKAKSARYFFNGPASDFRHLAAMIIEADVEAALIYVPDLDLELQNTGGPIEIKDGYLRGTGLKTRIAESDCSNGTLLLDLLRRNNDFVLEMDIDANLVQLPNVLKKVVFNDAFQDELKKFVVITGTAKAHLRIGDKMGGLTTNLKITEMHSSFSYERLQELIDIKSGAMTIAPRKVTWQSLAGGIGKHRVTNCRGEVSWQDNATVALENLEGSIDSASLYESLTTNQSVGPEIQKVLNSISGTIIVKNGTFSGPAQEPALWNYSVNLSGKGLAFDSPDLPMKTSVKSFSALLSQDEFRILASSILTDDSSLRLNGELNHNLFHNWIGWLNINGTVREKTSDWVRSKKWVPSAFFPEIPCTLKDLTTRWSTGHTKVAGTIVAGDGIRQTPRLSLDLSADPQHLKINNITIIGESEQASLSYDSLNQDLETFLFTWDGKLSADTIEPLLGRQGYLTGSIEGNCRLTIADKPQDSALTGSLAIQELHLPHPLEGEPPILVPFIEIAGIGRVLTIKNAIINLDGNESITGQGKVTLTPQRPMLELDLHSEYLSRETLTQLMPGEKDSEEQKSAKRFPNIGGAINFEVQRFGFELHDIRGEKGKDKTYDLTPFRGRINLKPHEQPWIDIHEAKLCCLNLKGQWHGSQKAELDNYAITAGCSPLPLFQDSIPCLGISQDIIEGPFEILLNLQGKPGQWQRGNLIIHSEKGRFLRMKLLAQIFKVVNLTDLFVQVDKYSVAEADEEKGFAYSKMDIEADIADNKMIIKKAAVLGEGINLLGRGVLDLNSMEVDLTILVAPLKTLDAIISRLPIIGRIIAGEDKTVVAIPVGVKGPLKDPKVQLLPKEAIGEAFFNLITSTLKLPYTILSPILPKETKNPDRMQGNPEEATP